MDLRAGLDRCGKSRPTGIRSPDRPARRQSLYRLRYPAHFELCLKGINEFVDITSIFRIYIQSEFMSEHTAAPTPNILHLPFIDLIY